MTSLSAELNRFCEFSKRTKQILDETKSCFDDINESGNSELGNYFLFHSDYWILYEGGEHK